MSEDDRSLLAMAAARMSPASIAGTLGWSERRVTARLAKLKAEAEAAPVAEVKPVADMAAIRRTVEKEVQARRIEGRLAVNGVKLAVWAIPAIGVELAVRGLVRLPVELPALLSIQVVAGMAAINVSALPMLEEAPPPQVDAEPQFYPMPPAWIEGPAQAPMCGPGYGGLEDGAANRNSQLRQRRHSRKPVPTLVAPGERRGVERLKPVTEARLRYCRWFHEAAWPVGEIAALFDVAEGELAQALGVLQ